MKFLTFILLNICLISNLLGQPEKTKNYFANHTFKEFSTQKFGIEVTIDPRIEFLQTLMLLAGNPHTNMEAVAYKIKVLDQYDNFKKHPAIAVFRELLIKKFNSLDAPIFFFVRLNNQFELRKDIDNKAYEADEEIRRLLESVGNLAAEMDYATFFNENAALFEASLSTFAYNLSDFDEKNRMLGYYRNPAKTAYSFRIVLNLLGKGNFGPGLKANQTEELYAIISPGGSLGNLPAFDLNEVHYLVWHEFSHSFVNPLIDKHFDSFQQSEKLHSLIEASMSAQGYADWRVTLKEHLVRAVTCRLAEQKYGKDFAEWNYTMPEIGKMYIYITPMLDILKEYENNVSQTFEEAVILIAQKLNTIEPSETKKLLSEVAEIRKPDVSDIPKIGEAQQDVLFIVPKQVLKETKQTVVWPGAPMQASEDGWYCYLIENTNNTNVIFNNGTGAQTEDLLHISGTKFYDWDKRSWVVPQKTINVKHLEKPNSVLVFFKPPTNWKNKPNVYYWQDNVQNNFSTFIEQYKNKFKNAQLITDEEALGKDLLGHDLVVLGNYENNAFLRKYYSGLPVKFTKSGFIADKNYEASDLVLISAWLHPTDKERKSELYITNSLENLVNIDWVQRGGTHYHITRGLITLKSGNYTRRMKIWRF